MKTSKRRIWLSTIAIGTLILLTLILAPHQGQLQSGSTFNRSPDGYGAWYAFMQERGTPVQRWQQPLQDLPQQAKGHLTVLQVNPALENLNSYDEAWVRQGHTLILLGVRSPVTAATFSTLQSSPVGNVKIDTTRRWKLLGQDQELLGDRFGAVVWQQRVGQGRVVFATTPHLAANAYQDESKNYEFLARLMTQDQNPIWVDEYMHGYRDQTAIAKEPTQDWITYLAQTPLLVVFLQAIVILIVMIWGQNRRSGPPEPLVTPMVDNSTAYIRALAGVLQKAECHEFVMEVVAREEQHQIQAALGLGPTLLDPDTVAAAWVQQTGHPATELQEVLSVLEDANLPLKRRISLAALNNWLAKVQIVRQQLLKS